MYRNKHKNNSSISTSAEVAHQKVSEMNFKNIFVTQKTIENYAKVLRTKSF